MGKTKSISEMGREGWKERLASVKWSMAWMALVGAACLWMWSLNGMAFTERGKAERISEKAARMSLAGREEAEGLGALMSGEAMAKAWIERQSSGLDEALSRSGAAIKTKAWTVKSERAGKGWVVKGFAESTIQIPGSSATQSWSGAWRAETSSVEGSLKVRKFKVVSLPEGAKLDDSAFSEGLEPSAEAVGSPKGAEPKR